MDSALIEAYEKHKGLFKGVAGFTTASLLGFYLLCRTQTSNVFSDLSDVLLLLKLRSELKSIENNPRWTMNDVFEDAVRKYPNGDALCFVGEKNTPPVTLTFKQLDEAACRGDDNIKFLLKEQTYSLF